MRLFDLCVAKKLSGGDTPTDSYIFKGVNPDAFWNVGVPEAKELVIPEGYRNISDYGFYQCTNLESLVLPSSIQSIGDNAFSGCESLKTLDLSYSKISSIGEHAFFGCHDLTSLGLPMASAYNTVARGAFGECRSLTELIIPSNISSIENSAFAGCSALTNLYIPNGVESIDDNAFGACISLPTLKIPSSVRFIGNLAFYHADMLATVDLTDFDGSEVPELGNKNAFYLHSLAIKFIFSTQTALDAFAAEPSWSNYVAYFEVAS